MRKIRERLRRRYERILDIMLRQALISLGRVPSERKVRKRRPRPALDTIERHYTKIY